MSDSIDRNPHEKVRIVEQHAGAEDNRRQRAVGNDDGETRLFVQVSIELAQ
jgi:hypothetical protein